MCAGIKLTAHDSTLLFPPSVCGQVAYLPDGDHGDERSVPLFSFCVRAGIYLTVNMAMSVQYLCFPSLCGQVFT